MRSYRTLIHTIIMPPLITYILAQVTVIMIPTWGYIYSVWNCNPYGGAYDADNNTMYICTQFDTTTRQHVTAHESGHYVWYKIMTQDQRDTYTILWDKSTTFPTDYAHTSAREWFAEDFAECLTTWCNKERNKRFRYVRKIINNCTKIWYKN